MPIKKLKKLAKKIKSFKKGKIDKTKFEEYAIILRIKGKHHAFYFYWPIEQKIRNSNLFFISKNPKKQVIEIHRISIFPKEKIADRLRLLDKRLKDKKSKY